MIQEILVLKLKTYLSSSASIVGPAWQRQVRMQGLMTALTLSLLRWEKYFPFDWCELFFLIGWNRSPVQRGQAGHGGGLVEPGSGGGQPRRRTRRTRWDHSTVSTTQTCRSGQPSCSSLRRPRDLVVWLSRTKQRRSTTKNFKGKKYLELGDRNVWHGSLLQTVDEQYLRTGPGSPGYTRASPRSPAQPGPSSPGQAGLGGGAARAGKRKSRDVDPKGSGSINTSKTTRCKRPKVVHST